MDKQEHHSYKSDADKKQSHATPKGSHKEKASENQHSPSGEGFMQGVNSQENKGKPNRKNQNQDGDYDRNEGEQRSQKS